MIAPSRRHLLLALLVAPFAAACTRNSSVDAQPECADDSALSPAERAARLSTLGYVAPSPDPARSCARCVQFAAGTPCGRCQIVRGPIDPRGRCTRWVERT